MQRSFSPCRLHHLLRLLHHRRPRRLVRSRGEWALILEDDVDALAPTFHRKLGAVLRELPLSWQLCYLGYHESSGELLPKDVEPRLMEASGQ